MELAIVSPRATTFHEVVARLLSFPIGILEVERYSLELCSISYIDAICEIDPVSDSSPLDTEDPEDDPLEHELADSFGTRSANRASAVTTWSRVH